MKKNIDRLLSWLMAAMMVFSMAACGDDIEDLPVIENTPEVSVEHTVEEPKEPLPTETPKEEPQKEQENPVIPETQPITEAKKEETAPSEEKKSDENTEKSEEQSKPKEETSVQQIPVNSSFSAHFIDVGQADAALVECDGHYMLIDGGNKADSSRIYSVLKSAGVSQLDMVVGNHAHEDHIGGLPGAYNYADVDLTLCPVKSYDSNAFADFAKYAGSITIPKVGDSYKLGSADVKILGVNGGSEPNDTSIVLKITYGETSFLFTGDAEREAEQAILNSGADLSATVLKVGHHGSDTSTTYPFLREIMPEYAIISVGKGNSYGHPTDATLSRLRDAGVKIYRTDLNGDIKVTSDGKTVSVSAAKTASNDAIMTAGSTVTTSKPAETSKPATSAPAETNKPATQTPVVPPAETKPKEETATPTPTGKDYVLNTNTKKFHYPSCKSVKQMSDKNRKDVNAARADIIAEGYVPCKNCNP